MNLDQIPGYSEDDWSRDRQRETAGTHFPCPNCGHGEWFHSVGIPPDTGADRKYRACKVCGFWQEADGSPAYRCWMTVHTCLGGLAQGQTCEYCGAWGPRNWHGGCWRILRSKELGVTACANCGVVLTPLHVIPWPVQAK